MSRTHRLRNEFAGAAVQRRPRALLWLPLICLFSTSECASAAAADTARLEERPNFSGIWDRVVKTPRRPQFDPNVYAQAEQTPPLKPEYMSLWKNRFVAAGRGDLSFDTSATHCLPKGMPRVMMAPFGLEILQTDWQINMFNEGSQETVRIVLDGRKQEADADPSYIGFTTGRWEGATLKTVTTGLRVDTVFDSSGIPHSEALTVEQSFRLLDRDTLENIVTLKDPIAFERDWVVPMVYRRAPKDRIVAEVVCLEGKLNATSGAGTAK